MFLGTPNSERKITSNERTDDRPICESGFLQKRAKKRRIKMHLKFRIEEIPIKIPQEIEL
jgi:hypothetical protein